MTEEEINELIREETATYDLHETIKEERFFNPFSFLIYGKSNGHSRRVQHGHLFDQQTGQRKQVIEEDIRTASTNDQQEEEITIEEEFDTEKTINFLDDPKYMDHEYYEEFKKEFESS